MGGSITAPPLIGLDCEMVQTEDDDGALARVTLVRLDYTQPGVTPAPRTVLLDLFVRPSGKVRVIWECV